VRYPRYETLRTGEVGRGAWRHGKANRNRVSAKKKKRNKKRDESELKLHDIQAIRNQFSRSFMLPVICVFLQGWWKIADAGRTSLRIACGILLTKCSCARRAACHSLPVNMVSF